MTESTIRPGRGSADGAVLRALGPALCLAIIFLCWPGAVWGVLSGMGGVSVGVPDPTGDIAGNPAAIGGPTVGPDEGLVHVEMSWLHLAFAGSAFNPQVSTSNAFDRFSGMQVSLVTPRMGNGRVGLGLWQMDRRSLELEEPANANLSLEEGGATYLGERLENPMTSLQQADELYALGAVWIHELPRPGIKFALGGAHFSLAGLSQIEVEGVDVATGEGASIFRLSARRDLGGFGGLAGFFYRPVPEWGIGFSFAYVGPLRGNAWEQAAGGPLYRDKLTRPGQQRVGFGGSVEMLKDLALAVEVNYLSGIDMTATLYEGTPAEISIRERSEMGIDARLSVGYPIRLGIFRIPLSAGFFMRPDPMPAQTDGLAVSAVEQFGPVAFQQDTVGFSLGGIWEKEPLRLDVSLLWLQVSTHVKRQGPTGWVDCTDTRNSFGAAAGVTLRFGTPTGGLEVPMP